MIPYLLLLLGLLLVLLEFFLPGAIMGIAGAGLIIASTVLYWMENPAGLQLFLFVCLAAAGIVAVFKFAIWYIPRTAKNESIYLNKDQEGYQASGYDKSAIGKEGIALSDLKPGGYILIEGQKHQALSVSGYITKGTQVKVISGEGESLIVQHSKEEAV